MEAGKTTEEQEAGDNRSCVRDSMEAVASDLIMVEDIVSLPYVTHTTYDFVNDIIIQSHQRYDLLSFAILHESFDRLESL